MNSISILTEMECIKKMDSECYEMFIKVWEQYAPKLSSRIVLDGSAFTPHDKYHCLDIYKIISTCLLRKDTTYQEEIGVSKRELFILNLAVLFHDIGMSNSLDVKRDNHSMISAEYVQREYNDSRSVLRSATNLTRTEIKALKAIIKAHSNVKGDPAITDEQNGIRSPELTREYKDLHAKSIRTLFLAGVLRLADEMDVTSERLGNGEIETEIEEGKKKIHKYELEGNSEALKRWEGFLESLKHWKRLHLFETMLLSENEKEIHLILDDENIQHILDEGSTEKAITNEIIAVLSKIRMELMDIKKYAFSDPKVAIFVCVERVDAVSNNEKLQTEIDKAQAIISMPIVEPKSKDMTDCQESLSEKKGQHPVEIDDELSKYLEEEVRERQLLQFGHYILNEVYCARDWLDIRELVETREISKRIIGSIVKHINSRHLNNIVILGMDMVGALIAARVAFQLKFPMSYLVSVKNAEYNSSQEIDFELKENEKVIIITESIVTFKTINSTMEKYKLTEKLDSIYTIFYRKTTMNIPGNDDLVQKTYSLNNSFPIELVKKEKCVYKKEKCFAKNKH